MTKSFFTAAGLGAALFAAPAAMAQAGEPAGPASSALPLSQAASAMPAADSRFDRFAPRPGIARTRIDYEIWDEALRYFVMGMGKSLRESSSRPNPGMGTRRVYGHDSLYRLEGNRVIFSYMTPEVIASLTEYRQDLERTADQIDLQTLSRNEQLAFWINLHNVAIVEQIALEYPVQQPSRIEIGDSEVPLDQAAFITVNGVAMSPRDIRTKIVYPNWRDPSVIYGFFRGDIGGPSIQRQAYTSLNASRLLADSANDFVNSLRGTQKSGKAMLVSEIYEEARPFYFRNWPDDIRAHLRKFAEEDVVSILDKTSEVRPTVYERDIADLAGGEREPTYDTVYSDGVVQSFRITRSVARLLNERQQKIQRILEDDGLVARVTIIDVQLPDTEVTEVE